MWNLYTEQCTKRGIPMSKNIITTKFLTLNLTWFLWIKKYLSCMREIFNYLNEEEKVAKKDRISTRSVFCTPLLFKANPSV